MELGHHLLREAKFLPCLFQLKSQDKGPKKVHVMLITYVRENIYASFKVVAIESCVPFSKLKSIILCALFKREFA